MTTDIARGVGSRSVVRRRPGRIATVAAALAMMALVVAPSAWATVNGTATLAPIGTGSYLLTIQNTGDQEVRTISGSGSGEGFTNFDPSGCIALGGGFGCAVTIAPGASMQLCYSGPAVTQVTLEVNLAHVPVTSAPPVASCPLPGFIPVLSVPPAPTPGGGAQPASPAPSTPAPMKCKKGSVKKTVHGKAKCVKRKHKKHKH